MTNWDYDKNILTLKYPFNSNPPQLLQIKLFGLALSLFCKCDFQIYVFVQNV